MKIAVLVPDLSLGGGQRSAISTAELLSEKYCVEIITFTNKSNFFDSKLKILSLECGRKKTLLGKLLNVFKRVYKFKRICGQRNYDVIISFLESANLVTYIVSPKKSILTIHITPRMLASFDVFVLRHFLKRSRKIVAVSYGLRDDLVSNYNIPTEHIHVIHNSVPPRVVKDLACKELFEHKRPYIVTAGRLTKQKAFNEMMDIFNNTKASEFFDLIIIGSGEEYEKLSLKKGNSKKIHLVGEKNNPFPIIQGAELFLLTSKYEAFPMVLLEALSLEKYIIAYDCPTGLKDVLKDSSNSVLIKNGLSLSFIEAVDNFLMKEKKLFLRDGSDPAKGFHPEDILKKWESLINT